MKPFLVDPDIVRPLRQALISRILELLQHSRTKVARKAAQFLGHALRYPMGIMGTSVPREICDKYDAEFERTLLAVSDLLAAGGIHPIALIALARSISWHAEHGTGDVQKAAKAALATLPTTLEFRLLAALARGFGDILEQMGPTYDWRQKCEAWQISFAAELKAAYTPTELHRVIERTLAELAEAGETGDTAHILVDQLLQNNVELSRIFIAYACAHPGSHTRAFLASALSEVLVAEPSDGQILAQRFLEFGRHRPR